MTETSPAPQTPSPGRMLLALGLLLSAAGGAGWYLHRSAETSRPPPEGNDPLSRLGAPSRTAVALPPGITAEDYDRAADLYRAMAGRSPDRSDVLFTLGALASDENRWETAAASFEAIAVADPRYGLSARRRFGEVLMHLHRAPQAEAVLREFLRLAAGTPSLPPEEIDAARHWLSFLLSVELRFEERAAVLRDIHAAGRANVFDSKQLFFPNLLVWNSTLGRDRLQKFLQQAPEDPRLNVAEGRYLIGEGRLEEARAHLEAWRRRLPHDRPCLAALLECHFERNDWTAFDAVIATAPPPDDAEPWLLTHMRGEHALHHHRWQEAVEHFSRLLRVEPAHATACMGLSRAYAQLGQPEESQRMQQRNLILARIRPALRKVTESDPTAAEELAAECEQLELLEAARVFQRHAERIRRSPSAAGSPVPSALREGDVP